LLKILSRITEPTRGRVILRGHVASLLEVGTRLHPELTGRENIFLNGAILGMSRKRKFDEIVAFAEVKKLLDTPVKHFSSGMYVRLAFAVAAHLSLHRTGPTRIRSGSGGGSAAFPVPCRTGKLRVKNFSGFPRVRKAHVIIHLETTPANNRRLGRETAGKPKNIRSSFATARLLRTYQLMK
jgi:hypothetical protein